MIAAQRQLYSEAKKLLAVDIILRAPFLTTISLFAIAKIELAAISGLITIVVFLVAKILIKPKVREYKMQAASIQEIFDSEVLGIPLGDIQFREHDFDELIAEYSTKYFSKHTKSELIDWYPNVLSRIDEQPRQLICQRFNSWWDNKLRKQYTSLIIKVAMLLAILINVTGLFAGLSLADYVLVVLLPILPIAELAYDAWEKNNEAQEHTNDNFKRANKLLERFRKSQMNPDLLNVMIRSLQDSIFNHRAKAPLVFDKIYNRYRSSQEKTMNETAEDLVALLSQDS